METIGANLELTAGSGIGAMPHAAPPSDAPLSPDQRQVIATIRATLHALNYDARIAPLQTELVQLLASVCQDDEAISRMLSYVSGCVPWERLPSYWLAYLFQLVTLQRESLVHVFACDVYSDAQAHQYDDLALSSLENAYTILHRNQSAIGETLYRPVIDHVRAKLAIHFEFYAKWCRPFDYRDCNILTENPHFNLTYASLRRISPAVRDPASNDPAAWRELREQLLNVINTCSKPEQVYYRIIARRLAASLSDKWDAGPEEAILQYEQAIAEARNCNLDAELGHLYRHYGWTLSKARYHEQAIRALEAAYSHDEHAEFAYWRALDAYELGDAWFRRAGLALVPTQGAPAEHPSSATRTAVSTSKLSKPLLERALEAYRAGRIHFEQHLLRAHLPIGRAIKLQMVRSYAENAIQIAAMLDRGADIIAEFDLHSPHEAAEALVLAESAHEIGSGTAQEVRQKWETFHRHLNTTPGSFEEYLRCIPANRDARQQYVRTRLRLVSRLAPLDQSDAVVKRLEHRRLPGVDLLFFYVGPEQSWAVLWMGDNGNIVVVRNRLLSDSVLRQRQAAYDNRAAAARASADPRASMQSALDAHLSAHAELLSPVFEALLPYFQGHHLKVFPVMQLTSLPIHAVAVNGRPLNQWCDVSYCQSLGLFEQLLARDAAPQQAKLTMVFDDQSAPLYEGIVGKLTAAYQERFSLLRSPSWDSIRVALGERPPDDLLFACHGEYDAAKPAQSNLRIGTAEAISFSKLFTELELPSIRSVAMGACESGLGRAELSSEYIGLPNVFHSAGVRYVIGSLWQVNALATAVLFGRHFELLADGSRTVPTALNGAQRTMQAMTRGELMAWVHDYLPQREQEFGWQIEQLDSLPFAHPYYWAGFYVSGAV